MSGHSARLIGGFDQVHVVTVEHRLISGCKPHGASSNYDNPRHRHIPTAKHYLSMWDFTLSIHMVSGRDGYPGKREGHSVKAVPLFPVWQIGWIFYVCGNQ